MRKTLLGLMAGACLAGCASNQKAIEHNPQVRHDQAQAEQLVQRCLRRANLITHCKAFVHCLSPGNPQGVEACAQRDLGKDGAFTAAERRHLTSDLTKCVLR